MIADEPSQRGELRSAWKGKPDFPTLCFDLRVYPDIDAAIETLPWELRERRDRSSPSSRRGVSSTVPGTSLDGSAREADLPSRPSRASSMLRTAKCAATRRCALGSGCTSTNSFRGQSGKTVCERCRSTAIEIISERHELRERCSHRGRLASRGRRRRGRSSPSSTRSWSRSLWLKANLELVAALARGVESPSIDVDAVGLVVLSSEPLPREETR